MRSFLLILLFISSYSYSQEYLFSNQACDYTLEDCQYNEVKTAFKLDFEKNTFQMYFKINDDDSPVILYSMKEVLSDTVNSRMCYLFDNDGSKVAIIAIDYSFGSLVFTKLKGKTTIFKLLSNEEVDTW